MYSTRVAYPQDGADQAQLAALETDIMRFFAIIGFCLMVIFALVQSLSVSSQEKAVTQEQSARQDAQLTLKELQVNNQSLQLENLQLQQQLVQRSETLSKLQSELQAQWQALAQRERQLTQARQTIADMKSARKAVADALLAEQARQQAIGKQQAALKQAQAAPAQEDKTQIPQTAETDSGFSLTFASEAVFQQLVAQKTVQLFAQNESGLWLQRDGEFVKNAIPETLYNMAAETVPADYRRLFAASHQRPGQSGTVQWRVALPADTMQQLQTIMQRYRGGHLEIDAQARVQRQPE